MSLLVAPRKLDLRAFDGVAVQLDSTLHKFYSIQSSISRATAQGLYLEGGRNANNPSISEL